MGHGRGQKPYWNILAMQFLRKIIICMNNEHTKRLNEEDKDYLIDLKNAKANPKNIATCLNQKTGRQYNSKDVRNLIKKIDDSEVDKPKAEEILGKIKDAGGNVSYTKDANKRVDALWIQTGDMVEMLKKEKPRLFQNDTTFGRFLMNFIINVITVIFQEHRERAISCI